ncbi:alpha/beta hydrolase [Micromonospora sp. 15K316]|uniref:alpha/beta hydrolase fold domain-containing protein n=1 Tax=Micromonospora sp. 15K316 TaxID=2530376 RepID=UPI00104D9843|nr:alpha/beta hydrolase [Micromonospora sp. 15K316]TDC30429.1 alpha/beta hydrolase [Micromonospora sp. 15K316]
MTANSAGGSLPRQPTVDESQFEGWPVHTVLPGPGDARGHVLYLHGGGYVSPPQPAHWNLIAELAGRTGRTFVVPDFPLAPEHTHRDVFPTLRRLHEQLSNGGDMDTFAVMGDSTGATMSLALVQSLPPGQPRPRDLILMSPWLDATLTNPEIRLIEPHDPMSSTESLSRFARWWAGRDDLATPQLSPINGPLEHLGRVAILAGTNDILTPDARRLAQLAAGAPGTDMTLYEYPDMTHAFMLLRSGAETDAVLAEITRRLGGPPNRPATPPPGPDRQVGYGGRRDRDRCG